MARKTVRKQAKSSGSSSGGCNGNHDKKMPMKGKMPTKPMKGMR